jgi:predicted AAA+ superfamily ATPase
MKNRVIERAVFKDIINHLNEPEMTLTLGARQTGKTTILFQIKDHLIENQIARENEILMFNLDFISDLELFKSQLDFFNYLKSRIPKSKNKKLYLFVDEAQRIENAGVFFKGLYDKKLPVKFILTGSSSFELKTKISEPLTGRKRIFTVFPFDFYEYLLASDKNLAKLLRIKNISDYDRKSLLSGLYNFINFGGYPRIVMEENEDKKRQLLKEIYSSYIEKDIVGLLKIRNFSGYTKLMKILAGQIGGLTNYHELSQVTGLSFRTIESYLEILKQTFVVGKLTPFFKNIKKELSKTPKIYFIDSGLRNFALSSFGNFEDREDRGKLLENYVFSAFAKKQNNNVCFWRTKDKSEVDFIVQNNENIIPIEIKAVKLTKPEITRGFRNFIARYNPKKGFLVNLAYRGDIIIGKTKIHFILPYEVEKIF